ncbi:acetylxylan esterase [Streptomyces sp. NPDC059629]|uniref:acetylxylan esterase n=1 Tax=Streptomyces sp. NPDC059629 TaxID=3346889 RepID=UPI0036AE1BC9
MQYVGYGGGRGHVLENLLWASAGYAHLQVDTRGPDPGWSRGATPDSGPTGPEVSGVMTRGISSPRTYYYRRLLTDAVRAGDAVRRPDRVDPDRVAVVGQSQGGGTALAVTALVRDQLSELMRTQPGEQGCPGAVQRRSNQPRHGHLTRNQQLRHPLDSLHGTRLPERNTLCAYVRQPCDQRVPPRSERVPGR